MLDPTPKDSATPTNTPESPPLILVCYHKFSTPIIASEILRPIIVGAANMGEERVQSLQQQMDSALGNHSGDFVDFRATADHKSCSALKSTKSTTSPTATPRILEEESQTRSEKTAASKKVDSRIFAHNASTLSNSQAEGFCDDFLKKPASASPCTAIAGFVGCQAIGKGATLAVVTADFSADSRKSAQKPTPFILRDDSGDNISHLNPHFCELTAMYWAWKNVDSSYYGLFHYRRILDLSEQALKAPPSLEPTQVNAKKKWRASAFGYAKERVDELLAHYDIILPQRYIDRKDNLDFSDMTLYDIYAKYHYAKDLDRIIELIKSRHPEMQAALEKVLFTKPPRWYIANMFIMRKELYFAYCEWLFPLLFALEAEIDISSYDSYQTRIYGFLAERIFNIWLEYQRQTTQPRILEAPMILFMHKKPLIGWEINEKYKRFYFFGLRLYKKRVNPKN